VGACFLMPVQGHGAMVKEGMLLGLTSSNTGLLSGWGSRGFVSGAARKQEQTEQHPAGLIEPSRAR
jgi:hypothetical protein